MKLYLSSYRFGNRAADLSAFVSGRKTVGVVRNALDFSADVPRLQAGREREFQTLESLGLRPEEIDLRRYFDARDALRGIFNQLDALWVTGGNSFILRRAFDRSGLDTLLVDRVADEQFVYAGYSAGVCVVTPTLRGIHLVDDPEVTPPSYTTSVIWDGLGLLPFCIAPHYRSDHPESELIESSVDHFVQRKIPFIALSDGDVYVTDVTQLPDGQLLRTLRSNRNTDLGVASK